MAQIFLGTNEITSGGSGGGTSYDDTVISGRVDTLEEYVPTYVTTEEYEALVEADTVDDDKMYIITDLADTDEIAKLATHADIEAALESLQSDLQSTADEYYEELSADLETLKSDITTAKTTAVSAVQSQQSTSVSAVSSQQTTSVNAVKSQQTTSVNAVTSAQSTAVSAVNTAKTSAESSLNIIVSTAQTTLTNQINNAPRVIVITESEYEALDSIVENALYIIKADPTDDTEPTVEPTENETTE